ncbi:protein zwilch homolog [Nematostella vectensis]|uniref:protein zwilch homolog n=1 Tax=Nematostella vectensis TaxID=45351 RepID=UPI0020771770|nr:protein zwilch homolog [Nematostella vectensis]
MDNFEENSHALCLVLNNIISQEVIDDNFKEAFFETIPEDEDGSTKMFNISFVSPGVKHPLQNIITKTEYGFFLVSKAILEVSHDEDGEETYQFTHSKLSRKTIEHVLVGTPISMEVYYINGREPLHRVSTGSDGSTSTFDVQLTNLASVNPVQKDEARYLISLFDYALANNHEISEEVKNIPLCVMVSGENSANEMSLAHLASIPKHSTINHVIVSSRGPFIDPNALPNINFFKKWHAGSTSGPIQTCGYAIFELLGLSHASSEPQGDTLSSVLIEFAWENVSDVLQMPPLSCNSVLHVQNIPGSMELCALKLNMEVEQLKILSEMLNEQEKEWPFDSEDLESAFDRTAKLLEKQNSVDTETPASEKEMDDTNDCLPFDQDTFAARKELDFTESLWMVLKDAADFEDVAASIQSAFFATLSGKQQPILYGSNTSSIAELMRAVLTCDTNEEKHKLRMRMEEIISDKSEILRCLVEIGVEKLLRDLTTYFLSEELVTQEQLSYYTDTSPDLVSRVSMVGKMHNILDLILTTKSVIDVGHSNLQLLTQSSLTYYKHHTVGDHPVFSLSLPAFGMSSSSAIKQIIASQKPSTWCVSLKSKTKKGEIVSVVHISTTMLTGKAENSVLDISALNEDGDCTINGLQRSKLPYYLTFAKQTLLPLIPCKLNIK